MLAMSINECNMVQNIKANWWFPISALAFCLLNVKEGTGYLIGIVIAGIIAFILAGSTTSFISKAKASSPFETAYALLCSAGTSVAGYNSFILFCNNSLDKSFLKKLALVSNSTRSIIGVALALVSSFFVFVYVFCFWEKLSSVLKKTFAIKDISWREVLFYLAIIIGTSSFVVYTFTRTDAFYWASQYYDVIYTSDSPAIFRWNAYLTLTHQQNDLRQPLFAVFSIPFLGALSLISEPFFVPVKAILLDVGQIVMLTFSNYLLARIMGLPMLSRIAFVLLFSSTYTYMLFSLMMEQYIIAYFWVILFLYVNFCENNKEPLILYGAGGTLLTSLVLLPFSAKCSIRSEWKQWVRDLISLGIGFVTIVLGFCRFDVIYNAFDTLRDLASFAGTNIMVRDKVLQYLAFIHNLFTPPVSEVVITETGKMTWQLAAITKVDYYGVFVLLLAVISIVINHKNQSTWIFAGWWLYSIVIMVFLGWGTQENGLILYSLYFGWPLVALIFQLLEKVGEIIKSEYLSPAISVIFAAYLIKVNFTAIKALVTFMTIYYPLYTR